MLGSRFHHTPTVYIP